MIDSLLPYSLAISELLSTASALATILSLKARLQAERRGFGMIDYDGRFLNSECFVKHGTSCFIDLLGSH